NSDPTTRQMLDRITNEPYMLRWLAAFADRHGKPTCIGEWANTAPRGDKRDTFHGRGDCPEYIDAIYDWAATCRRGCRYVCYFNLPDGGVELTLDQTPASLARLKARAAEGAPRATP
ncbi:MAG TPA: hypothetical protein VKE74_13185, partial [Gemmataceae bacterium]|nr:hypothetical protein [Gemmataceae bacterium]